MEASKENFKDFIFKVNKTMLRVFSFSKLFKVRQNPAPRQFPQKVFQNMNPYITNQNVLASPPLNYASYTAGNNLSSESYLKIPYDRSFSNFRQEILVTFLGKTNENCLNA